MELGSAAQLEVRGNDAGGGVWRSASQNWPPVALMYLKLLPAGVKEVSLTSPTLLGFKNVCTEDGNKGPQPKMNTAKCLLGEKGPCFWRKYYRYPRGYFKACPEEEEGRGELPLRSCRDPEN